MTTYKTPTNERIAKRMQKRLEKIGYKLVKRGDGYAILVFNEVVNSWIEADGMSPVPYCLTVEDVVRLTHEYVCEAEVESLHAD